MISLFRIEKCWTMKVLLSLFLFIIGCFGQRTITINGGWSPWSTIATDCLRENLKGRLVPVTCGGGKMIRTRSCTNPVPQVSEKYT